jgi:hypothetical protein
MAEDLLKKGLSLLKLATDFDSNGQTQQAIAHYLLALDVLVKCHGYEKLETNRAVLKEKISLYMNRVELLKQQQLPPSGGGGGGVVGGGGSSGSVAVSAVDVFALPSAPSNPVLPTVPTRRASVESRSESVVPVLQEKTVSLVAGQTGTSYSALLGPYLRGSVRVTVEDPFLSAAHQLRNLVAFVELVCATNDAYEILVITRNGGEAQIAALEELRNSLRELGGGVALSWKFSETLHDRAIRLSNGWKIVLGRGLDWWQKPPAGFNKFYIGATEQTLRRTLEFEVHFLKDK